jgi:hypothetical protein
LATFNVNVSAEPSIGFVLLAVFVKTTVAVPVGSIVAEAVSASLVAPAEFGVVWLSVAVLVTEPEEDVACTRTTMDAEAPEASAKPVRVGEHVAPHVTVPAVSQRLVPGGAAPTSSTVTDSVAVPVAAFDIVADVPLATAVMTVPTGMLVPVTGYPTSPATNVPAGAVSVGEPVATDDPETLTGDPDET